MRLQVETWKNRWFLTRTINCKLISVVHPGKWTVNSVMYISTRILLQDDLKPHSHEL